MQEMLCQPLAAASRVPQCNLAFDRTSLKGGGRKGGGGMGSTIGLPMGIMSGLGSGGFL
jgi:hypothetical protein